MQWFLLACDLLVPVMLLVFGRMMWKHCPKESAVFGYRTRRSTRNAETWQFANTYIGKLWWILGWIVLPLSAALPILFWGDEAKEASLCGKLLMAQSIVLLVTILPTENALKKKFPDDEDR